MGAEREDSVERTSPKHKTCLHDFSQLGDLALVRRVIWLLYAVRSADRLVDRILSPGVDEGACLVDCRNANHFIRRAKPRGGVRLSCCLTAASVRTDFCENKILLGIGQPRSLCSNASHQCLDLGTIGVS